MKPSLTKLYIVCHIDCVGHQLSNVGGQGDTLRTVRNNRFRLTNDCVKAAAGLNMHIVLRVVWYGHMMAVKYPNNFFVQHDV